MGISKMIKISFNYTKKYMTIDGSGIVLFIISVKVERFHKMEG